MNTSFNPSPLSATALVERQLADWQQFKADLTLRYAPAAEITYADEQIQRLQNELFTLTLNGDVK